MTIHKNKEQRSVVLWMIAGVVGLFFVVIALTALEFRRHLRDQIIHRDSEVFMAVASSEVSRVRADYRDVFPAGSEEELYEVVLNTSDISGVLGVRLFDREGLYLLGTPAALDEGELSEADFIVLGNKEPIGRFSRRYDLSDTFLFITEDGRSSGRPVPVSEILIPLFALDDDIVSGYAHYFLDGQGIVDELAQLDGTIFKYAGGAFLLGGLLGSSLLYWAFRKLRVANELLEDRTQSLILANHKLSMEARTAAIGAITSHLIHGLKSPLHGIKEFVTAQSNGDVADPVWDDAIETTDRMQQLINEVIEVLQDRGEQYEYELSASEICDLVDGRVLSYAERNRVVLKVENKSKKSYSLPNNRANLAVLILVNLVRNAVDASSSGGLVVVQVERSDEGIVFKVTDEGSGLPKEVLENLFQPVSSTKEKGSGVGLALCQELARHLDGELKLSSTGADGTCFQLTIKN